MGTRLITWQKPNGDIIERQVSYNYYRIGDTNSYKWIIIDIKYWNGKKFCNGKEYNKYLHLESQKEKLVLSLKDNFTRAYKQFLYLISLMVFFRVLGFSTNIIM